MELLEKKMDEYFHWLRQKYKFKKLDGSTEITTPFKNHLNDSIRIYMDIDSNEKITLSDDGQTFNELDMYGIDIHTPSRQKMITSILNQFSLKQKDDEIITDVNDSFAQSKHNLVQGILKVYDLTLTSRNNISSLFYEEVFEFLFENDIGGSDRVGVSGSSGISYTIDYIIPPKKNKPEILLNFSNNLDFNRITTDTFTIRDVSPNRHSRDNLPPKMYVIANDTEHKIPDKVYQAAFSEGINILRWSNKEEIINELNPSI